MKIGVCGNSTIQHKYKNCYFFGKSDGNAYLALAVALATWYNGQSEESEYRELNLSDSFMKSAFAGQAALECRALMLNINLGLIRNFSKAVKFYGNTPTL